MNEKPCNDKTCDVFATCNEGKGLGDYRRTCHRYQRYLGHQEGYAVGESELSALRAEVEVMRRAVGLLAQCVDCDDCPILFECSEGLGRCPESQLVEWAISEARKGEGC